MNADTTPILKIQETNFESEVLRSKQPVLVAFLAPWSQPCEVMRPVLEEVATACAGKVKVAEVNADYHPYLGLWYEIHSIPTLVCFAKGGVCARVVGTASKEAILSKLQPFLRDLETENASEKGLA
jgi:thioredoxin 1